MEEKKDNIQDVGYDLESTQQQRLITVLGELEDEVEKQNSFRHIFLRGALQGLGTVIGATVLLTLLVSIIALLVDTFGLEDIPFIGNFIEGMIVEQLDKRGN